ncbi:hypothetical protein FEM48_Zijuj04G0059500 [Ziziphus jujuba var. spinosa]|uniref:Serpin domain-containing protein n=1 Tax=Ziziphus jujuba var. spinosa TaxID=714518 RepID=A0A978VI71_ZIZJJ|nr:hypothetical protein FEM48_Zijuj04G0059500 [Ziziphus jujuba var. spinosa]
MVFLASQVKGTRNLENGPMLSFANGVWVDQRIVTRSYQARLENVDFLNKGYFDGYKVVQIPYQSGIGQDSQRLSMYFFLPNEKDGLPNLIQTLKLTPDFLYQEFELKKYYSEFWIPKFKFSYKFEASEIMKEIGLKLPFKHGELTDMINKAGVEFKDNITKTQIKSFLIIKMENLDFCLLLTNKILENKAAKGSNSVASPLSSHVMLSLIAAGSKGQTLQQLLHFLGSNSVADLNLSSSKFISLASPAKILFGCPLLSFVNGAWLDQRFTLKSSFQKIVKGSYKAELKSVDFVTKAEKVVEEVNLWAETSTRGLIKQLLPSGSLNRETALVVANALYFKGVWERKFETSMTQLREFHLLNGQTVKKDGLLNLIQTVKLSPGFLNQRFELRLVDIPDFYIPKFKFCFEFEASKTMKEMGLKLPFKPGELTEMGTKGSESDKLYVLDIFHKSFIEVNEEGTEAASTTALCLKSCRSVIRLSFVAEHPFLFMIREETHGMVFFVGAVLNPLPDA